MLFRPKTRTETALLVQAYSTIIGAVLGAIPTALDWGRVWQSVKTLCFLLAVRSRVMLRTWPVTVLWGAFFGNMLGAVSALIVAGLPENLDKPRPAKKKAGSDVVNAATKSSGKKQR